MEASDCMNLDKYWNYVAIPLLLVVISFAIYIIFTVTGTSIGDGKGNYLTLMSGVAGKLKSFKLKSTSNASVGTNSANTAAGK